MSKDQYDIVLFGATSFVGKLVARYFCEEVAPRERNLDPAQKGLSWAMAGRSLSKLEDTKKNLGPGAQEVPLLTVDAGDYAALEAMCRQAKVIISTVGPYALYGTKLIEACVSTGTDYCDLSGEVLWLREIIERYQEQAQKSGARIVNCCGFDSVPSDLGVYFLQGEAFKQFGQYASTVEMRVRRIKGGFSGGTVASMVDVAKRTVENPKLRRFLADPHHLCVDASGQQSGSKVDQGEPQRAALDPHLEAWSAPFIMAGINTRIVHRSNYLQQHLYGADFRYNEAMLTGKGFSGQLRARALTAALGAIMLGVALGPTRWVLQTFVLPSPGQGPSETALREGRYELWFRGEVDADRVVLATVSGEEDPGYLSTSKMLGEAGMGLLRDCSPEEVPGGFWTPATALGERYIERLRDFAGLSFGLR